MTPAEILSILAALSDVYMRLRENAKAMGVTDEQLAEADARFQRYYPDPLAGEEPEPQTDPTSWRFESEAAAAAVMGAAGLDYLVIRFPDGDYGIWPKGVGPVPGEIVG